MDNFYLHLYCGDSLTTHVNNRATDFVVDLPRTYVLNSEWECALTEIAFVPSFERITRRIYICSDVIEQSYVRNTSLPVLRSIPVSDNENTDLVFNPLFYFKIQRQDMSRVQIFIRDDQLQPCRFKSDQLYCTLHFRQKNEINRSL